ncbi:ABC transporter permease [Streptomyces sp. MS19]|uniref:ABC transporter permease n=1 Tax=Streptomyces sp. MS19 TaxID=3385972 RepID=UPI0039A28B57
MRTHFMAGINRDGFDKVLERAVDEALDQADHLVLPGLSLALGPAPAIGRVFRSSLLTTLDAEYVRTTRSKGLGERAIVLRHVVRNSLNAALSMSGLQIGFMFAGVLVVESVFSRPGPGGYLSASIPVSDFPAVAGVTFLLGAVHIVADTVVDVLQCAAGPRVTV